MSKKGGLGRGLSALIPQEPYEELGGSDEATLGQPAPQVESKKDDIDIVRELRIVEVSPSEIDVNPHQPRTHFKESDLSSLENSIKEHGILQPLVVTQKDDGRYELIAGERRLRASRRLNLAEIPVVVRSTISDQKKLELALIENVQRAELNPVEEAKAYEALADLFSLTQEEVAERVSKSRSYVANLMRLLDLDEDMLDALEEGALTKSHARTLLSETDRNARRALFEEILSGKVTVRDAESRTSKSSGGRRGARKSPEILALEEELTSALDTKVTVKPNKQGGGTLQISYYSAADLKQLKEYLTEDQD
jgi:ParB family chromosome partitioning protein